MIDLFSISLCSVSLDGGNHTVLYTWENTADDISSIAVLHDKCGTSISMEYMYSVFVCVSFPAYTRHRQ